MISKELLSAVLGIPLLHIRYNDTTNLYEIFKEDLFNWSDGSYGRWSNLEVNIYELAHKCKEWAFEFRFDNKPTNNRYYRQRSGYEDKFNVEKQKREKLGYMTLTFGCLGHTKTFYADTEPEAIFKACQWILDKDSK